MSETIAAIATPPGIGGLAVIRLSGPASWEISDKIFQSPGKKKSAFPRPRRVYYGNIVDPDTLERVDAVLITFFKAPASYTGEDVVEISCHGSPVIAAAILQLVEKLGAQPAQPGEFTRRAFLNNKIDLSQAEAVALLTAAESTRAHNIALKMLSGGLSDPLNRIRDRIHSAITALELDMDFPEEEPSIPVSEFEQALQQAARELSNIRSAVRFHTSDSNFRVIIAGNVNAGKSTLFNRLIGRDRAIVASEPGTTRDLIESRIRLEDFSISIIDTAGFRESGSEAENEGMRRAMQILKTGDILIYIIDALSPEIELLGKLAEKCTHGNIVVVWNKIDQGDALPEEIRSEMRNYLSRSVGDVAFFNVSAKTGEGVDGLRNYIQSQARAVQPGLEPDALILSHRQQHLLDAASQHLESAMHISRNENLPECVAMELRSAYAKLGEIIGDHVGPDILDAIFSRFCIGK